MRKLFFLILLLVQLFATKQIVAQVINMNSDIKNAYYFDYMAKQQIKCNNLDSALKLYKLQFKLMENYYPAFESSYLKASEIAAKSGDYEFCAFLLDTLFNNGFYLEIGDKYFNKEAYRIFKTTEYFKKIDSLKFHYSNKRYILINQDALMFISELYYKDQVSRKCIMNAIDRFKIQIEDTLQKEMLDYVVNTIDCENRKRFIQYIRSKEIEFFKYNTHYMPILYHTIFIHNMDPTTDSLSQCISNSECDVSKREFYIIVQPFLLNLVKLGWLNNQTYAEIIDRSYSRYCGYQLYGSITRNDKSKNEKEGVQNLHKTNILRKEIGLFPIE